MVTALEAMVETCREIGLVTALARNMRDVFAAARPSVTKTSRLIIAESRKPTPSKPASSHVRVKSMISWTGA